MITDQFQYLQYMQYWSVDSVDYARNLEPGTWNLEPRIWNQRALITDQIQYIQYWAVDSVIAVIAVHSVHAVLISTFGSRQVYLPSKILLILANTAITAFTEDSTFQLLASSFSERVTNEFIGIT